ncbi:MAG TPA: class I tRNA ligase family protein, partial [Rhizomicrobium sp.]|nr:class I tRNA ligase family protein [Rhizomicrobium sp.]
AEGCWRFVQRVWRLATESQGLPPAGTPPSTDEASKPLRQAAHRAIAAVTDDLENLRFNRAVAQLYTLANAIGGSEKLDGAARREAIEALVLLCAPMMPHLAEQCWKELGHDRLVAETPWPKYDPDLVKSDQVMMAVQVNGKRRAEFGIAKDTDSKIVEKVALEQEAVIRALEGKTPKKIIVVPNRIVNIVV